jgi:hypothetical protein
MRSGRPARPWAATSSPSQGPLGTGRRCRCGWPPPARPSRPPPTANANSTRWSLLLPIPSAVGCGISPRLAWSAPAGGFGWRAPGTPRHRHRGQPARPGPPPPAPGRRGRCAPPSHHCPGPGLAPELSPPTGVGPIVAAVVLCAWSHPGRGPCDAAFAMLGGAAPIPASSGQTVRVRLNRSGDRQLNQALHVVVLTRLRSDPATRADAQRRRAEGRARPTARSDAAWSARWPASATDSSKPSPRFDPP